jgi:hypothetical protein
MELSELSRKQTGASTRGDVFAQELTAKLRKSNADEAKIRLRRHYPEALGNRFNNDAHTASRPSLIWSLSRNDETRQGGCLRRSPVQGLIATSVAGLL